MELVEGVATVGGERFPDTDAFVDRLTDIGVEYGVTVQAFDARYIVGERHLARAMRLADRERDRGDAIARNRAVEILLYAAGRRQIRRALDLGVSEGETPAVVLVASEGATGNEPGASEAVTRLLDAQPTLGDYDPERVRAFFDIGAAEAEATDATLADLVLERIALLVIE
ncbi:KEOPS complex component [Halosegnis rubeus]|jgi:KEOPS complex subunit Cgi121|uniref:KEOPS complex component n=1 Tax=Halosegnis rubeus TaxID=2212850 RepID=A0A5N5UGV9_9EURY|nr:KEOPS complex subunit Cgi121 [Halosegnis rubeus]KAB7515240.1 KEOPS complex component [Halosegnis rubeus]KAB7516294.1 KEOPS complex component [Halosegnis rubeus]KAB7517718.1 KEOPS complex component [Halosegnis rubeus]